MNNHIKYIFPIFFQDLSKCIILEQLWYTQHIQKFT